MKAQAVKDIIINQQIAKRREREVSTNENVEKETDRGCSLDV